jgi:hypothetical protein
VVVTVTPEAVVVATEWVIRGPAVTEVPVVPVVPAAVPAAGAAAAVVWAAWWARATAAVPVTAIRNAAVQLDTCRTCRRLSRRSVSRLDGSMFVSFHAVPVLHRVRDRR